MNADAAKVALEKMLADIEAAGVTSAEARGTVMLDQTSVGRLSRMDAMERQAMAQATEKRRLQEMRMVEAALRRLDQGEWGACVVCGDDIAPERLAANPAVAACLTCASGGRQDRARP